MTENQEYCTSCKVKISNIDGTVTFKCPECGKKTIVRCKSCRKIAAKYTCSECGFTGPN